MTLTVSDFPTCCGAKIIHNFFDYIDRMSHNSIAPAYVEKFDEALTKKMELLKAYTFLVAITNKREESLAPVFIKHGFVPISEGMNYSSTPIVFWIRTRDKKVPDEVKSLKTLVNTEPYKGKAKKNSPSSGYKPNRDAAGRFAPKNLKPIVWEPAPLNNQIPNINYKYWLASGPPLHRTR